MKRILKIFHSEVPNINQAALLLGLFSLISQLLGLVRDRSLAHFIGVGSDLDIYYAAFRIPDFIFVSFASLFTISALLPFLSKKISADKDNQNNFLSQSFFNNAFSLCLYMMIGVSIIFFFLMPWLVKISFTGFSPEAVAKTVSLSRIMLLSPILLGLSNLFGSITLFFKKFFIFALCPIFYNIGILLGILFLYPKFGIFGLVIGVVFGAFLHFLIQIPVLIKHKFHVRLLTKLDMIEMKNLFKVSLPRTAGLALYNITVLILISMASLISSGSISVFNFAFNLYTTPIFIIGTSYSVAAFPTLAALFSKNQIKDFSLQVMSAVRQIIFWSMPCIALFVVLRAQIVRVILGTGKFNWDDTRLVAAMLAVFALSVVAQSLNTLLVRAFYAAGDTWRPLWINLSSSVFIVVIAKILVSTFNNNFVFRDFIEQIFRVSGVGGTTILMLGLAFSLGLILNFFLLWFFFEKNFSRQFNFKISKTFWQSFLASVAIGVVSYYGLNIFANIFDLNTFLGIFMQGVLAGGIGILVGVLVLFLMRSEELIDTIAALRTKFWKIKVTPAPQEEL